MTEPKKTADDGLPDRFVWNDAGIEVDNEEAEGEPFDFSVQEGDEGGREE